MKITRKKIKPKPQVVQIKESDGTVKKIGKYFPSDKLFKCTRSKKEHFMIKHNGWGLDAKVVDYLVSVNADVLIKDTDTKWEYKCFSGDFKIYGVLEEHKQHRPQYFLSIDHWTIERAKDRSFVLECAEITCESNFGKNCLRGVISIGENGTCGGYVERG